jgi:hypothetical protein
LSRATAASSRRNGNVLSRFEALGNMVAAVLDHVDEAIISACSRAIS